MAAGAVWGPARWPATRRRQKVHRRRFHNGRHRRPHQRRPYSGHDGQPWSNPANNGRWVADRRPHLSRRRPRRRPDYSESPDCRLCCTDPNVPLPWRHYHRVDHRRLLMVLPEVRENGGWGNWKTRPNFQTKKQKELQILYTAFNSSEYGAQWNISSYTAKIPKSVTVNVLKGQCHEKSC